MAALVDALERVLARGSLRRNLIIVGESDEEFGSIGARDVLAGLGSRSPDWVLATEPTELRVATRHKGIAVARICATGTACHSSNPAAGRNAIVALSEAVLALDALAEEIAQRSDPSLGPPTLSVGVIGGGMAANIVPDRAWLLMDRRMLPGETEEQVRSEIEMALARRELDSVEVETCRVEKPPLETPNDHPAVLACCAALSEVGVEPTTATVAFGTDAGVFADGGLPGVVMGPGSIAQAHTAREFVPTREVETMADFFEALLEGRNVRNG
jgi:acetylornithine deacetylase